MLLSTKFTFLFACVTLFVLQSTQAFCIYNQLDFDTSRVHVFDEVKTKKSFDKTVSALSKECCHWSDRGCNPTGDRESYLGFNVRVGFYGNTNDSKQVTVYCQAGGYIVFRGSNWDNVNSVCHHVDGSETFEFLKNLR